MTTPDEDRPAGTAPPVEDGEERVGEERRAEDRGGEGRDRQGRHGRHGGDLPRSRTGTAWVAICVTVLVLGLLIVFMAQNTETVGVSFLWMDGTVPLAVALLIAAAGAGLLAATVGTVRIAQLRRLHRKS